MFREAQQHRQQQQQQQQQQRQKKCKPTAIAAAAHVMPFLMCSDMCRSLLNTVTACSSLAFGHWMFEGLCDAVSALCSQESFDASIEHESFELGGDRGW